MKISRLALLFSTQLLTRNYESFSSPWSISFWQMSPCLAVSFCHLISFPSLQRLGLSAPVVRPVCVATSTLANSFANGLSVSLDIPVTAGDQLSRLHLEKLVICDLGQELTLEVLRHMNEDLRELRLDSRTQDGADAISQQMERFKKVRILEIFPKAAHARLNTSAFPHLCMCHTIKDPLQTY
jgi:hypothetical protein